MELQRARIHKGSVDFASVGGFDRARVDGFFFIEQPPDLSLDAGDRFARGFYQQHAPDDPDSEFTGYSVYTEENTGPRQGYFCRQNDQTEQFFLERNNWARVLPESLATQAEAMRRLSLAILDFVLRELDIPQSLWHRATGGAITGEGCYHLTFNHFRPQISARGLNIHKDSGWVTLLRSTDDGLEVQAGDGWESVSPAAGHLIVNFGCALEILTRSSERPLSAVAHRVRQQVPREGAGQADRVSYGLFVDSELDRGPEARLYEHFGGQLIDRGSPSRFVDAIVERTYDTEDVGLY
jgi:2OG-Fe(II) oxygenase superfamily